MSAEPMLRVVHEPGGRDRPPRTQRARVKFSDGVWRDVVVHGWRHDQDRWYTLVEWDSATSWRLYDVRFIRPE